MLPNSDILSQLLPESFWNEGEISEEMMQEMGQDFSNLYPSMPIGDGYQTFEDEEDEPLPGGNRHVKEEVVVDNEGRPVAEVLQTIEEQETGDVLDGEDAKEAEEELEKELEEIEPEEQDDFEQALQGSCPPLKERFKLNVSIGNPISIEVIIQLRWCIMYVNSFLTWLTDVEAIATAEEESKDDLDDEMVDAADDNSAWKDLVLLLDEGNYSLNSGRLVYMYLIYINFVSDLYLWSISTFFPKIASEKKQNWTNKHTEDFIITLEKYRKYMRLYNQLNSRWQHVL